MIDVVEILLVVVILWMPDGSYQSTATPVEECPNIAIFGGMMEQQRHAGSIKSWIAYCTPAQFGVEKKVDT
tara:strand:+ start:870 stop:1082 length:213 start_codon:yes stop_codon:yes gene_type:complete